MNVRRLRCCALVAMVLSGLLAGSVSAQTRRPARPASPAQKTAGTPPKFKAIWEPVNYKEDLNLTDVYFVSALEGWVAGEHGTILHTKDGGDTWTAQVGGDPQSADDPIEQLRHLLLEQGLTTEDALKEIDREVKAVVTDAADFALAPALSPGLGPPQPPDPGLDSRRPRGHRRFARPQPVPVSARGIEMQLGRHLGALQREVIEQTGFNPHRIVLGLDQERGRSLACHG